MKGKSVNTSAFILAVLSHLKLVRPLPGKKRQHELLDEGPFHDRVQRMVSSGKAPRKKTASKKRATVTRKKTAKKKTTSR